jgi:hypothetical protein
MRRILMAAFVSVLCVSCSGGGINSYEDGIEAQVEIMAEMISVLEGVTDEASADAAAGEIEALGNRLADVAAQIRDLPEPSMEELQAIAERQQARNQEFQMEAASQMMKLAQYESLRTAWMRAIANVGVER